MQRGLGDYDEVRFDFIQMKPRLPNSSREPVRSGRGALQLAGRFNHLRFEFLIGLRYLRARRRERFVSLIANHLAGRCNVGDIRA